MIYSFEISPATKKSGTWNKTQYEIKNEQEDHSVAEDEIIIDFLYNKKEEDYIKDFIRTNKSFYGKRITNSNECEEYVDVKCNYEWYKDEVISKSIEKIVYIYDGQLITKEGKIYNKK